MPNVVDLYSGVGGLSLGASRAGFDIVGAVEIDPQAIESHARNFPTTNHSRISVTEHTAASIAELCDMGCDQIDGIIGGPPCQGFSIMGGQNLEDPRNNLFHEFFRIVNEVQPKFFLAENVPGILSEKYDALRETAFDRVADDYVILPPFKVTASDYGAPTTRTRVLFVGYKSEYVDALTAESFAPEEETIRVNVAQALGGLPASIRPEWQREEDGWRRIERLPKSEFSESIYNNIPANIGHMQSIRRLFDTDFVSGFLGTRHTPRVEERYNNLLPGRTDNISRAARLDQNAFCPTLRAGTGSDRGSYQAVRPIHPTMPRVITPREAARLQGFPDWFQFHSTKWHSFRQIGNSVSPILAEKILSKISEAIENN